MTTAASVTGGIFTFFLTTKNASNRVAVPHTSHPKNTDFILMKNTLKRPKNDHLLTQHHFDKTTTTQHSHPPQLTPPTNKTHIQNYTKSIKSFSQHILHRKHHKIQNKPYNTIPLLVKIILTNSLQYDIIQIIGYHPKRKEVCPCS